MVESRRTSEAKSLRPFMAAVTAGVNTETAYQDVQALLQALASHKTSADHDGRYYTEIETNTLLNAKADKTLTITAGNGLTGGGALNANMSLAINYAADHVWNGEHTFNEAVYLKGLLGIDSDQVVINNDGTNVDVELQLYRTTGGAFSFFWNGVMGWTTKPFRPAELIINRISDTAPLTTYAGMVWVHPHA